MIDDPLARDIDKRKWMRAQPSYGPGWDAAFEFGIDVSLIEQNLALRFEELRPEGPVETDTFAELRAIKDRLDPGR